MNFLITSPITSPMNYYISLESYSDLDLGYQRIDDVSDRFVHRIIKGDVNEPISNRIFSSKNSDSDLDSDYNSKSIKSISLSKNLPRTKAFSIFTSTQMHLVPKMKYLCEIEFDPKDEVLNICNCIIFCVAITVKSKMCLEQIETYEHIISTNLPKNCSPLYSYIFYHELQEIIDLFISRDIPMSVADLMFRLMLCNEEKSMFSQLKQIIELKHEGTLIETPSDIFDFCFDLRYITLHMHTEMLEKWTKESYLKTLNNRKAFSLISNRYRNAIYSAASKGIFQEICSEVNWDFSEEELIGFIEDINVDIMFKVGGSSNEFIMELFMGMLNPASHTILLDKLTYYSKGSVSYLLDRGVDIQPFLHRIIYNSDLGLIQDIISRGMDFSQAIDSYTDKPAITLGKREDHERMRLILEHGLKNSTIRNAIMRNIFTRCCHSKEAIGTIRLFLEYGCSLPSEYIILSVFTRVNFRENSQSFNEKAILNFDMPVDSFELFSDLIQILIDYDFDINCSDYSIFNSVIAHQDCPFDLIERLVDLGADPKSRDSFSLRVSADLGRGDLIRYFSDRGADVNADSSYAIKIAIRNGDLESVKALVELGADIDGVNGELLAKMAHDNPSKEIYSYLESLGLKSHPISEPSILDPNISL